MLLGGISKHFWLFRDAFAQFFSSFGVGFFRSLSEVGCGSYALHFSHALEAFCFSAKRLDQISEAFHRFLWRPLWLVFGLILGRFGVSFPLSSQVRRCIFQVPIYIRIAPPLLGF